MMTGQEPADDETEPASEPDPSTQATLDEFSQTGEEQQSSILDDEIFLAGVPDSIEDGARTSDNPFHCQSGAVRAFENLQQSMAEIRRGVLRDVQQAFDGHIEQAVRDLKEVSRSARLARRAVAPALVTSAVASSTVAGVDPAVIQTMGQLPLPEFTEAVRVMAELNTQPLMQMVNGVNSSVLEQVSQEFRSLSTLAVTQLAEQVAQQMQDVTRIAEQVTYLPEGVAGVGAMGAAAARPGTVQGFGQPQIEQSEVARPPTAPESAPAMAGYDLELPVDVRWIRNRVSGVEVRTIVTAAAVALAPIFVEVVFFELQQRCPTERVTLTRAKFVALALLELLLIIPSIQQREK